MPDPVDPDSDPAVTAIFLRAACALAASPAAAGVTVTTADRATPLSPWSLAWAEWGGPHELLIRRHLDPAESPELWDYAGPEGRLATLPQLAELVSRVAGAARKAGQDAGPGMVEGLGRDVAGALGALASRGEEEGRP